MISTIISAAADEGPDEMMCFPAGLHYLLTFQTRVLGAQWLSGRALDSRPKGRGFEPHRRHCVVVLEQDTFILA